MTLFRDARLEDVAAVVRLYADDDLGARREVVSDPPEQEYLHAFEQIDRDPRQRLVVVEDDGEIVATLQLSFVPHLVLRGGERAQLEAVRVRSDRRGSGLGVVTWHCAAMPLGHLGVNVPDLAQARDYYDRLMPLLGYEPFVSGPGEFSYKPAEDKVGTYLFFYASAETGDYSRHRTGLQHLAFLVSSRDRVHEVHQAVVALASEVVHEPREFPEYHLGYYAAFWLDPFGHMLEVVCHKP